ncbi:MAG TPA: hydrogenase nickel incorporation protein HypB [Patescibacteria group bacterium]|nr:hydrogenase nickel incorporation protein HypB [Patescibacteria group bacterium]
MNVQVMTDILAGNDRVAGENRELFRRQGVYVLNLLGSPGAGKTMLLEQTISRLKDVINMVVIEGDLYTQKDAERIARHGVPAVQINTDGGCHLDAAMIAQTLERMDLTGVELLIVENVGNLVCPAEFDVGEDEKAVVLSITEGADKPLKYPLPFRQAAATVLNKIDLLPFTDVDLTAVQTDIVSLNRDIRIFAVSCRSGEGVESWCDWLQEQVKGKQNHAGKIGNRKMEETR